MSDYRLSRAGSFVWTQVSQGSDGPAPGPVQLFAHGHRGSRRLDYGDITGLALTGETVTWTSRLTVHTARLG